MPKYAGIEIRLIMTERARDKILPKLQGFTMPSGPRCYKARKRGYVRIYMYVCRGEFDTLLDILEKEQIWTDIPF